MIEEKITEDIREMTDREVVRDVSGTVLWQRVGEDLAMPIYYLEVEQELLEHENPPR